MVCIGFLRRCTGPHSTQRPEACPDRGRRAGATGGVPSKLKRWHRPLAGAFVAAVLLTLAACGGGGDNAPPPVGPAPTNTLAYVDTACHADASGFTATQELRVRRGESAPVTVALVPMIRPLPSAFACVEFGVELYGGNSLAFGAYQRLGVSPDGTGIVFEVTDDFSILGPSTVPAEQKGIFFIRADGGGLRRLGDASRIPSFTTGGGSLLTNAVEPNFRFSPSGRYVAFTDMGPGPGDDAAQVFLLDVESGQRTQVTHLPPAPLAGIEGTRQGNFLDERTILFLSFSNPDGLNPGGKQLNFSVNIDGSELKALSTVAISGGAGVIEVPAITGFGRLVRPVIVPGMPLNPLPGITTDIREVFITDGANVLQLTNFQRTDTATYEILSVDGERVFFTASVDPPLGTNPLEVCQIFSVDALGADLRQLTTLLRLKGRSSGALRTDHMGALPNSALTKRRAKTRTPGRWSLLRAAIHSVRTCTVSRSSRCVRMGAVCTRLPTCADRYGRAGASMLSCPVRGRMDRIGEAMMAKEIKNEPQRHGAHRMARPSEADAFDSVNLLTCPPPGSSSVSSVPLWWIHLICTLNHLYFHYAPARGRCTSDLLGEGEKVAPASGRCAGGRLSTTMTNWCRKERGECQSTHFSRGARRRTHSIGGWCCGSCPDGFGGACRQPG